MVPDSLNLKEDTSISGVLSQRFCHGFIVLSKGLAPVSMFPVLSMYIIHHFPPLLYIHIQLFSYHSHRYYCLEICSFWRGICKILFCSWLGMCTHQFYYFCFICCYYLDHPKRLMFLFYQMRVVISQNNMLLQPNFNCVSWIFILLNANNI